MRIIVHLLLRRHTVDVVTSSLLPGPLRDF